MLHRRLGRHRSVAMPSETSPRRTRVRSQHRRGDGSRGRPAVHRSRTPPGNVARLRNRLPSSPQGTGLTFTYVRFTSFRSIQLPDRAVLPFERISSSRTHISPRQQEAPLGSRRCGRASNPPTPTQRRRSQEGGQMQPLMILMLLGGMERNCR